MRAKYDGKEYPVKDKADLMDIYRWVNAMMPPLTDQFRSLQEQPLYELHLQEDGIAELLRVLIVDEIQLIGKRTLWDEQFSNDYRWKNGLPLYTDISVGDDETIPSEAWQNGRVNYQASRLVLSSEKFDDWTRCTGFSDIHIATASLMQKDDQPALPTTDEQLRLCKILLDKICELDQGLNRNALPHTRQKFFDHILQKFCPLLRGRLSYDKFARAPFTKAIPMIKRRGETEEGKNFWKDFAETHHDELARIFNDPA